MAAEKLSHSVIRHAYENVLTACARLAAFATCDPATYGLGLIYERQEILAVDDLVTFAISARRLIENTMTPKEFLSIEIFAASKDTDVIRRPVVRIINIIVHHKDIYISRSSQSPPRRVPCPLISM
jgi:hypothetical protein